ncbi:MAG: thioredoxin domain-containing protein [Bdellovibrionia bacterium]
MSTPQSQKTPVQLYIIMVLALIGIGLSVYLSQHFFEVRSGAVGFKSICNIGSNMNCDAVAASKYAEVAGGIPLSSLATGWLLGIFAVAMMGMGTAWRRVSSRLLIGMGAFAVGTSLAYLFVMIGILHTYCLFCLVLDVVNVLIFGAALTLKPQTMGAVSDEEERSARKTMIISVLISVFVAVVATKGMDNSQLKSSDVDLYVQGILSSPTLPASADGKYPVLGPSNAPITVVEFSDFQCPHCQMAAKQFNAVLNRFPGKVKVVFRNFPLDMACNHNMKQALHAVACEAARVAYCANEQGKFKEVYEDIFENQNNLKPGMPAELAKKAGLDEAKLNACVQSAETQMAIQNDIAEADRLQVQSTPTLFVNGHKVEGALPLQVWDKLVDAMAK